MRKSGVKSPRWGGNELAILKTAIKDGKTPRDIAPAVTTHTVHAIEQMMRKLGWSSTTPRTKRSTPQTKRFATNNLDLDSAKKLRQMFNLNSVDEFFEAFRKEFQGSSLHTAFSMWTHRARSIPRVDAHIAELERKALTPKTAVVISTPKVTPDVETLLTEILQEQRIANSINSESNRINRDLHNTNKELLETWKEIQNRLTKSGNPAPGAEPAS